MGWSKLLKAYDFKDDRAAVASRLNPADNLRPMAGARIPILLVYGDADRTVPRRQEALGGGSFRG